MFDNIGDKIKTLATVITVIGIIGSTIGGLALMGAVAFWVGLLVLVFGSLLSWVGCFLLFGFGELISNTDQLIRQNEKIINNTSQKTTPSESNRTSTSDASKMTTTTPKIEEKKEEIIASERVDKTCLPIKIYKNEIGMIKCPVCLTIQNGNRYVCHSCGQKFINGQPDITYWCGKCGQEGPFENNCTKCGSSMRIFNS